ncbi:GLE1-like [Cinara cedri]|uniref:mRNA export factor GLE1 n=1 Tax=Cinara cedri TaxID=506608 RepID=A0A5E4MVS5_9HEMI|nr:GLE1-like [Cinara cedri]
MAPNASFFNFNLNNHALLIRKNICQQFMYNNNYTSTLLKNRLKLIRSNFSEVNSHYLKENLIESVNKFSSSKVIGRDNNESEWFCEFRSNTSSRLELIRKTMVQQSIKEIIRMWQKKKDEMLQNKKNDISPKPKFQHEEIIVKKENYQLFLDQIKNQTNIQQTIVFNSQQRNREICFKGALTKAVLIVNNINNYLNNQQLIINIDKQINDYQLMKSQLDILKNVKVVEEVSLIAVEKLLKDLILYKNDVMIPIQAKLETIKANTKLKKNPLNIFSVNIPNEKNIRPIKRQYGSLVKNNRALIKNLNKIKNVPFINDPTKKLFRQNLIKVITTLVNTISSTNAVHLNDKFNKLNDLLSGKLVYVGNTQVMIGNNQEVLAFCLETLATKIISYAEEVICVKTEAAFAISAVIIKLWKVHHQFGNILVAEIKQKCPLLVPFCYPIAKNLTVQQIDHYSFGYKFDSLGNIESHDKYLKRMTGILRLYAVLILTSSIYDQSVIALSQAWIFLAGTLNQNPMPDITATMLVEFLSIVSFAMHQKYGKQFIKLLKYINSLYLKKIILITPAGHGGPITRLNSFLSKSLFTESFEKPKGMLSSEFL